LLVWKVLGQNSGLTVALYVPEHVPVAPLANSQAKVREAWKYPRGADPVPAVPLSPVTFPDCARTTEERSAAPAKTRFPQNRLQRRATAGNESA
jgi:hypothetical protein